MSANFFNGAALGMAKITSFSPTIPDMTKYDQIQFLAEDSSEGGFVIDKIYGVNGVISTDEINRSISKEFAPKWTPSTYLMAEFNGNTNGGNIPGISTEIDQWLIYRYDEKDGTLTPVAKEDGHEAEWFDYGASKDNVYKYWIFATTKNGEMSSPIITNEVQHEYFGWFLIDVENKTAYAFNLNQAGGAVAQGESYVEHNTNSKYHIFSRGKKNYLEGSVSAIVADNCSADTQSLELIESIREFILSDREKIVKDNKGRVFKAFVSGYQDSDVAPYSEGEFKFIDFSFKESGEV